MTRTGVRLASALAAGSLSAAIPLHEAHAGFTGLTVTSAGTVNGRSVFQVWAHFSNQGDVLRKCLNHTVLSGSMSSVMHDDGGGGSWNPICTAPLQSARDSFVTISGLAGAASCASLEQGFAGCQGPSIPQGAGWFNPTPAMNPVPAGADRKIMVMQVALAAGGPGYTARLSVECRAGNAVTVGVGTYTVPSAAGLALVPLLPFLPKRRRRSPQLQ